MHLTTTVFWTFGARVTREHLFNQELSTCLHCLSKSITKKKKKKKGSNRRANIFRYKIKMSVHITITVKQHISQD